MYDVLIVSDIPSSHVRNLSLSLICRNWSITNQAHDNNFYYSFMSCYNLFEFLECLSCYCIFLFLQLNTKNIIFLSRQQCYHWNHFCIINLSPTAMFRYSICISSMSNLLPMSFLIYQYHRRFVHFFCCDFIFYVTCNICI